MKSDFRSSRSKQVVRFFSQNVKYKKRPKRVKIDFTHLAQDIGADMEPHGRSEEFSDSKPSIEDDSPCKITEEISDQEKRKRFPANNLLRLFQLGRQGQSDEGQENIKAKRFTMNYMDLINGRNGARQY